MQERSEREGMVFVSAYDDPYTIAGQGTMGHEILRQTDMDQLDTIFVAVGGGGMIAGIAAVVKALKPHIKVIGVEPAGANSMTQSLVRGSRVQLSKVDAFADGVAIKVPGAESFRLCRELLDGVVLVDNSAISTAIKDVFNDSRTILEPAGAVALAGAKAYLHRYGVKGSTVVAVTSGANMNFDRLRLVLGGAAPRLVLPAVAKHWDPWREGSSFLRKDSPNLIGQLHKPLHNSRVQQAATPTPAIVCKHGSSVC